MAAISIRDFGMSYGTGDFGLSHININIEEGEFVVLTGGTGSGKSTLLRQLKREFVSREHTGSIEVLSKDIHEHTLDDTMNVGYVMQFPREQVVTDKVYHELSFGLENMGLSASEIRMRVSETAYYFGLTRYMDRDVSELSGGELQLINLASVMAMRPKVLLLDEPTSQLDEVSADRLISLIYRINRELGTTVVIAEHRLDMLETFSQIIIMSNGEISYSGIEPRGYGELPIYRRVGELVGKRTDSIVQAREVVQSLDIAPIEIDSPVTESRDKVLEARDIWYRYSRDSEDVLRGADITLYAGEVLGIVGGNGAGKSTFLSILSGGKSTYKGKVNNYGHKVVYIPQNVSFVGDSVGDEIDIAIKAYLDTYKSSAKRAKSKSISLEEKRSTLLSIKEKYLHLFDLEKCLNTSPYQISGGERAKLAILIALLSSPDVLLLDEPTKGLDRDGKELLRGVLDALKAEKKSIILVSHDIELIAEVGDRVATLFGGQILSICTPRLLLSTNYLYTTTTSRITRDIVSGIVREDELLSLIRDSISKGT